MKSPPERMALTSENGRRRLTARSSGRMYAADISPADDKQRAFVLRIDLAVRPDRKRCVRRAERQVEEDVRLQRAALIDGVQIAIFAVRVDDPVHVHDGCIDAPLEPDVRPLVTGGVGPTGDRAIGVARAFLVVGVLELPFNAEARTQLGDEKWTVLSRRADAVHVAIRSELRSAAVLV